MSFLIELTIQMNSGREWGHSRRQENQSNFQNLELVARMSISTHLNQFNFQNLELFCSPPKSPKLLSQT